MILRRLPYGTPSFFRRLLSVEAFNFKISAAPPVPSIMPPVLSKTRWRYVRSSSSSGTKSFDAPANASRETGWALGPGRSTVKTSSSASNTLYNPLAQRGYVDRENVQSIKQIGSKVSLVYEFLQIPIGRRNNANIEFMSLVAPNAFEFASL